MTIGNGVGGKSLVRLTVNVIDDAVLVEAIAADNVPYRSGSAGNWLTTSAPAGWLNCVADARFQVVPATLDTLKISLSTLMTKGAIGGVAYTAGATGVV